MPSPPERAWRDAEQIPYWLDSPSRPAERAGLTRDSTCDLAVVGGGFSGLWTALLAKERDPDRDVLLLEGSRIGWAATGRNGGFCAASLTHGEANGRSRFGEEYDTLNRLGMQNLNEIEQTVRRYNIDCCFERTGELSVATEPYQVAELAAEVESAVADASTGARTEFLDRDAVRAELNSPTYLAGMWSRDRAAMIDPARLAWGLAAACESLGVRITENTTVDALERTDAGVQLRTPHGTVLTRQAALGTNAFPSLLRRLRLYTVPVYDYVLMTEPLSAEQLDSIGWRNRQGVADSANQFHYYRLTADNRILWGGYDAIYHLGRQVRDSYDQRPATFALLSKQFFETFPQLEGLRFSHRWGGAIDTCTRFCAFYGTALSGRVGYALGYTGLGVGATRFGAQVMLDQLAGEETERTELAMVRSKPLPFPPEPLAYAGIEVTRRSLARADRREGRRNLWLRALDRVGLGFDS
ncbi:MAG TPA: FAD-binding oxidoreductase [Jatrophihabitans sp.]|jgi:glycine/D-amino acid oxidase-like deaminating enzyme